MFLLAETSAESEYGFVWCFKRSTGLISQVVFHDAETIISHTHGQFGGYTSCVFLPYAYCCVLESLALESGN
jgi:hypothetical protein